MLAIHAINLEGDRPLMLKLLGLAHILKIVEFCRIANVFNDPGDLVLAVCAFEQDRSAIGEQIDVDLLDPYIAIQGLADGPDARATSHPPYRVRRLPRIDRRR